MQAREIDRGGHQEAPPDSGADPFELDMELVRPQFAICIGCGFGPVFLRAAWQSVQLGSHIWLL